jgi:hypothetical protein
VRASVSDGAGGGGDEVEKCVGVGWCEKRDLKCTLLCVKDLLLPRKIVCTNPVQY